MKLHYLRHTGRISRMDTKAQFDLMNAFPRRFRDLDGKDEVPIGTKEWETAPYELRYLAIPGLPS